MIYNFDNLCFQVLTVDRFSHQNGFFDVKPRPYAALSFRICGTGAFEIGKKRFVTKPGDVLFLPADTPYKVEYSFSKSIVVHFERCNYREIENICFENSSNIRLCFEHLLEEWNANGSVNRSKSIIYDIFYKMSDVQHDLINDTVFADCVNYIKEHYRDPNLDVKTLCNISSVSVSSLQRAFMKYSKLSPKQYLIRLRMNRAFELLTKNEFSVKEVSFACGFTDEKYFSRAFKKRYGYPPSLLKNNMII